MYIFNSEVWEDGHPKWSGCQCLAMYPTTYASLESTRWLKPNSNYIPGKLELDRSAVVAGSPNSRPMIELSSRGCLAHGKHYCGSTTYFSHLSLRFPMLLEC